MEKKNVNFLNVICVIVTICVFILFLFKVLGFNGYFFGYRFGIVLSESMEPVIPNYSLLVEKKSEDKNEIKVGDIISVLYKYEDGSVRRITHRLLEINENILVTKGDNNSSVDDWTITLDDVESKVILVVPYFFHCVIFFLMIGICFFTVKIKRKTND